MAFTQRWIAASCNAIPSGSGHQGLAPHMTACYSQGLVRCSAWEIARLFERSLEYSVALQQISDARVPGRRRYRAEVA